MTTGCWLELTHFYQFSMQQNPLGDPIGLKAKGSARKWFLTPLQGRNLSASWRKECATLGFLEKCKTTEFFFSRFNKSYFVSTTFEKNPFGFRMILTRGPQFEVSNAFMGLVGFFEKKFWLLFSWFLTFASVAWLFCCHGFVWIISNWCFTILHFVFGNFGQ